MPKKDFAYYEKQLRECADLKAFDSYISTCDDSMKNLEIDELIQILLDAKQKRIELLNGLLESIGKTPF